MDLRAQDRIAHIIEMRNLTAFEKNAILDLRRITNDRICPDNDIFADISPMPDLAIRDPIQAGPLM